MKRILVCLVVVALGSAALAQTKPAPGPQAPHQDQDDGVTYFDDGDATMNAAVAEARATLDLFLTHAITPQGQGIPTAMLKVAFPAQSRGGDEIIWVEALSRTATGFGGYLANQPVDMGPLRHGDYVEFGAQQINDWGLDAPSGQLYGHFTTRVIAAIPGNAHIWDLLVPDPIPTDWR